jgi:putative ABC transport system substrate-binding protein
MAVMSLFTTCAILVIQRKPHTMTTLLHRTAHHNFIKSSSRRFTTPFFATLLTLFTAPSLHLNADDTASPHKRVAITQIVEHPSLDAVRISFIKALEAAGYIQGENLEIAYETAQGSVTTAVQIAKKFASTSPDVVLGISTPAAQALMPSLRDVNIPMVFAAVSDPVSAKLVKSLEKTDPLVTGATDAQPITQQFDLIQEILPTVKSIGVVYNPGEINSLKILEHLKDHMKDKNIKILANGASKSAEVASALLPLLDNVDCVYVTLDNVVVSALQAVIQLANKQNIPVFSTDPDLIKQGVLASIGNGYEAIGTLAGEMAVRILGGESPSQIPISAPTNPQLYLNLDVAARLHISIPETVKTRAAVILQNGTLTTMDKTHKNQNLKLKIQAKE